MKTYYTHSTFTITLRIASILFILLVLISANQLAVAQTNALPVAQNITAVVTNNMSNAKAIKPLTATDADGTIASFTIVTLPASHLGTLYVNNTPATANQVITPEQATKLSFKTTITYTSSTSFNFRATDNRGGVSATATYSIEIWPDFDLSLVHYTIETGPFMKNQEIVLTYTVSNLGTIAVPNNNTAITNFLPAGFQFVDSSLDGKQWNTERWRYNAGSNIWTGHGFAGGASITYYIKAKATSNNTEIIAHTARVESTNTGQKDKELHITNNSSTFSAFDDQQQLAPLPVELASFLGQVLPNANKLTWATATEKDNDRFIIERSQDGKNFAPIGQVKGSGTSTTRRTYSFTDTAPAAGVAYYRLRQVDLDGAETLSTVVALEKAVAGLEVTVFPTVATTSVTISMQAVTGSTNILVLDAIGRPVTSGIATTETLIELPVQHLKSGIYYVRIANGQNQQVQRFIKQ